MIQYFTKTIRKNVKIHSQNMPDYVKFPADFMPDYVKIHYIRKRIK